MQSSPAGHQNLRMSMTCMGMGIAAAAVLLAMGCRHAAPRVFTTPYEELGQFYPETIEHLTQVLTERHAPWETMRTESSITLDLGDEGRKRFDANLLVAFPDKARLRGSRAALGTLFEVISSREQLHVYFNRDGVLFSGRRSDLDESAGFLRLVGPDEILRALLAERDLADQMRRPGTWKVRDRGAHWLIASDRDDGQWQIWVVRKVDFLVEETLLGKGSGPAEARIRYWKYEIVDGEPVPTYIEIQLANPRVSVRIEVSTVEVNPPLRDEVFLPPSVSADHWYPLYRMQFDPLTEN